MPALDTRKPEWSKDPEPVDFKLFNKPLEQIHNRIITKLERENRAPKNFYFLLKGLLITSFQTYKAIRKLVADDPKYPAQAHILGRPLIDTLFTITAITEKPEENVTKYEKAGYRNQWEDYEREKTRYANDSKWKDWLEHKGKYLESLSQLFNLSAEETNNPTKTIKPWPNPNRLLRQSKSTKPFVSLTPNKQNFLTEVINGRYGQLSEWSHVGWEGIVAGVFATKPEAHWHPGKFESDAAYIGMLFLLMILSEIEVSCKYDEVQKLRYVWGLLNSFYDEAKEYYNLRYDNVLKQ